eukprot:4641-Heterococcus_DN1.PRE.2
MKAFLQGWDDIVEILLKRGGVFDEFSLTVPQAVQRLVKQLCHTAEQCAVLLVVYDKQATLLQSSTVLVTNTANDKQSK